MMLSDFWLLLLEDVFGFSTFMKGDIASPEILERKWAFLRIQSAHSLAMAC